MSCFCRVVPPRRIVCKNPRLVLVGMYGDLPEDFRNMRDRRESYNRPVRMKRSEMDVRDVESEKKERTYWGTDSGGVYSARIERGRAVKARSGDHNLGWVGRSGRPARNRPPRS
jgi:hypothetical protein